MAPDNELQPNEPPAIALEVTKKFVHTSSFNLFLLNLIILIGK